MTVFGCLNHEVPLTSSDNSSVTCETGRLGCACPFYCGYGDLMRPHICQEAGWKTAETVGASGPGAWHGLLCPCPSSALVPALPRGRNCPLPSSPRTLPVCRAPGRLPALCQRHGQPQPPADPLPPDRQLVPEPPLTLCHRTWVRDPACPLFAPLDGCPHYGLHLCAVGPCVCWPPCCLSPLTCVHVTSQAVCHHVSACVGYLAPA